MLDDQKILSIVASELSRANYSNTDQGYGQLEESMGLYLGLPNGKEVVGRSTVTSTDVADSIEWILPQIMESFTEVNEVVRFDPIGPGDARQAALESQFVYDILMKENNGYIAIHEMVKDALMQRNGILKVYYEKVPCVEVDSYTSLTEYGLIALSQVPDIEITSVTQNDDGTLDVSASRKYDKGKIVVECVPLEEFRVNAQHNSIDLCNSRFTAHVVTKTFSDLLEEGYSDEVLDKIPSYHNYRRDYRFAMMDENNSGELADGADESQHFVQVHECFMRIDIDGDGIAELMKITCAGSTDEPNVILKKEQISDVPWVSTTAILMPHKFQGLSIVDRVKEIQEQKTAIIRNILDNMYLQNNGRQKVLEGQVNLDDLLVSRVGGLVRVKHMDAIAPIEVPQLSPMAYEMVQYLDTVRAGRTGVQADGNASPIQIGDRVGSEGVERLLNGKEALVGLMIRTIAETGIKPLMVRIRDLARKHFDAVRDYEFQGEWVQIAPTTWVQYRNSTVKVGTGSGDKARKLAVLDKILDFQSTAIQNPMQTLVDQSNIFTTLDEICKLSGLNGASKYFIDPMSTTGLEKQKQISDQSAEQQASDAQALAQQMELQNKLADAQVTAANAQLESARLRFTVEQLKQQLEQYKSGIDAAHKDDMAQLQRDKMYVDAAVKLTDIEAESNSDQDKNFVENISHVN